MRSPFLQAGLLAVLCGCIPDVGSEAGRPCKNGRCLAGFTCVDEVCVAAQSAADGSLPFDAGHGGAADSGAKDGSLPGPDASVGSDAGDAGAQDGSLPSDGGTCPVCSGETPLCDSGSGRCVCSSTSCGSGRSCAADGTCVTPIKGTFQTVYLNDTLAKTTVAEMPYQTTAVGAWLPNGTASGYDHVRGTVAGDGTFSIPAAPSGPFFLEIVANSGVPSWFELKTHTPVFTTQRSHRADLAYPNTSTNVTINLSNLVAYASGDALEVLSSQADINLDLFSYYTPYVGDTTYAADVDWNSPDAPDWGPSAAGLPSAAKNDVVYFAQAPTRVLSSGATEVDLRQVTRSAKLTTMTLNNGVAKVLSVPLTNTVAQTGSLAADVRYTQFAALASEVNPKAMFDPGSFEISVHAAPYSLAPITRRGPMLLDLKLTSAAVDLGKPPDHDYGPLPYGQPLDSLWNEFRAVEASYMVRFMAPGATSDLPRWGYIESYVPMSPAPAAPIAPVLGPPQMPKINGLDAFDPQAGVGLQPTLSWSAPRQGTATRYWVILFLLENDAGNTKVTEILEATVFTGLSFKVPPSLLVSGKTYFAKVNAFQSPVVRDSDLGLEAFPMYRADVITATFTP